MATELILQKITRHLSVCVCACLSRLATRHLFLSPFSPADSSAR